MTSLDYMRGLKNIQDRENGADMRLYSNKVLHEIEDDNTHS
jgi:hypothetical protein